MKNIDKKYWVMFITGFLLTFSYILVIMFEDKVVTTWLNIIAMLGSGILCSAIVSYMVEDIAKKAEKIEHERQCKYIFSNLFVDFTRIAKEELRNLSLYRIFRDKNEDKCWINKEMTMSEIISEVQIYLEELSTDSSMANQFMEKFDSDYLTKIKEKNALAFENALPYYRLLKNSLTAVLENSNVYYLAHVFSESQISALKDIEYSTSDVIANSHDRDLEQTFIMKKCFFDSMEICLREFGADITTKTKCYYRAKNLT
jgi:hypothetical protein